MLRRRAAERRDCARRSARKAPVFVDTQVLDQAKSVDVSTEQADQERLQRWLESLDPDDLGYKM